MKFTTAQDAVKSITSHSRIYIQCAAATPTLLTHALTERAAELQNVEICHLQTFGDAPYADVKYKDSFFCQFFLYRWKCKKYFTSGKWLLYAHFSQRITSFI